MKFEKSLENAFGKFDLDLNAVIPFGRGMAKYDVFQAPKLANKTGKLILVTAMSPTPKGEGKTTTTIGLADGLSAQSKKALICLRQPSMGPCFGVKGGATGGGKAQLTPMESINLNFTGDIHAIGAAHNLLSAMIDNHIFWGNELQFDTRKISWRRVVDMNDRALRQITQSLGGSNNGYPREDGFDISVASEVMAIFCLARDYQDLQLRLGQIRVGVSLKKEPLFARDLKAQGAMAAILKNAFLPNMVQTLEGTPAFVHGGPFANIAHGCSSVIATQTALTLADFVVTEAGFGADLGAEKFLNIKCRQSGIWPDCAVLVATVRSIKYHGDSLSDGIANVRRHVENLQKFKLPVVVAINKFESDTDEDLVWVQSYCKTKLGVECVINTAFLDGSKGAIALASAVSEACSNNHLKENAPALLYPDELPLLEKINTVAREIYRAESVQLDEQALKKLIEIENQGFGSLPICVAKTQYSFSSDPKKLGAADGHILHVKDIRLSAGAGFVVVLCGEVMTMPGLPRVPSAESISLDLHGTIRGLF